MIKIGVIFCFAMLLMACLSATDVKGNDKSIDVANNSEIRDSSLIDTSAIEIQLTPQGNYNLIKEEIQKLRQTKNSKDDFENYLLNKIIPHWYGTEWDFNGYTSIPNQGVIACGYFVSTTLEHIGIVINRYHLAQQAGLNEAKTLAIIDSNYFTVYGIDNLQTKMESYADGIYFV